MAEYTTNLNLEKPLGGENLRRQVINDNMDRIDAAVGEKGKVYVAAGTANALVITTSGSFQYTDGNWIKFVVMAENTGAVTINIDGKGVKSLKNFDSTDLATGELVKGPHEAYYSANDNFFVLRPSGALKINGQVEMDVRYGETISKMDAVYVVGTDYTFTKLSNPSVLPAGVGYGVAFSPDGTYLAVAHETSPYITIYKRFGDTFANLSNPVVLPAGVGYGATFSPDGTYLVVGHGGSRYITIYKRSEDTFTKLSDPAILPVSNGYAVAFSPDGTYLAVGNFPNPSPGLTVYKRSEDTFTKLSEPTNSPTSISFGVAFGPDGTYLAVAHNGSPNLMIYKRSGDVFTRVSNPSVRPAGVGHGVAFSPDGTYLAVAHETSPYITIYKLIPTLTAMKVYDGVLSIGNLKAIGYANHYGTTGTIKKITLITGDE